MCKMVYFNLPYAQTQSQLSPSYDHALDESPPSYEQCVNQKQLFPDPQQFTGSQTQEQMLVEQFHS